MNSPPSKPADVAEIRLAVPGGSHGKWQIVQQTYGTFGKDDDIKAMKTNRLDLKKRRTLHALEDDLPTPWIVDPQVWWRHPAARIANAWMILILDFWIYFEDPINESHVKYTQEGFGQVYSFCLTWSDDGNHFVRALLLLMSFVLGLYIGNEWIHHRLLRDWIGLSAFSENKGAFFVKLGTLPFTLYLGAHVYNLYVSGSLYSPIDDQTHVPMHSMAAFFQYGSVFLDVLTLVQVTDVVLQDRKVYAGWATSFKVFWNDTFGGWVRVILVWILGPALLLALYGVIWAFGYGSEGLHWDGGPLANGCSGLNAAQRTLLASCIIFCDLLQVSQDWEFPTFETAEDTMVVGTFETDVQCNCFATFLEFVLGILGLIPEWFVDVFKVDMDGAWMIYGPLFCSLAADLMCAKNQFQYAPEVYGQYKDIVTDRVWTIFDDYFLADKFNDRGVLVRPEYMTYGARRDPSLESFNATSVEFDVLLKTQWIEYDHKWLAALPGILGIIAFFFLVWLGESYWQTPVTFVGLKEYASSHLTPSWLMKRDSDDAEGSMEDANAGTASTATSASFWGLKKAKAAEPAQSTSTTRLVPPEKGPKKRPEFEGNPDDMP